MTAEGSEGGWSGVEKGKLSKLAIAEPRLNDSCGGACYHGDLLRPILQLPRCVESTYSSFHKHHMLDVNSCPGSLQFLYPASMLIALCHSLEMPQPSRKFSRSQAGLAVQLRVIQPGVRALALGQIDTM